MGHGADAKISARTAGHRASERHCRVDAVMEGCRTNSEATRVLSLGGALMRTSSVVGHQTVTPLLVIRYGLNASR